VLFSGDPERLDNRHHPYLAAFVVYQADFWRQNLLIDSVLVFAGDRAFSFCASWPVLPLMAAAWAPMRA
jgi:hypothetical protein